MYRCPFCHSTKISKEADFNEFKDKLKEMLESEDEQKLPLSLKKAFNDLLLYDIYDDEQYLKNLEEHGLTLICDDCGTIFKEKDIVSDENFVMPTEISKEEFFEILRNGIDEHKNELPDSILSDKERFISGLIEKRLKYFKEKAYELIEDLLESVKLMNEFSVEDDEDIDSTECYIS